MVILSKIRHWYFRDKLSLGEIARRIGYSRKTFRRFLRDEISDLIFPNEIPPALDAFADSFAAVAATQVECGAISSRIHARNRPNLA